MNGSNTIDDTGRQIKSVNNACAIIESLRTLNGAGVSELASAVGLSKATVHSHLVTLLENELVVKRGDTYEISLRFVDFAEYAKNQVDIYEIAASETENLANQTGEVAQFMVEEHGLGVYLHKASGKKAIQTASYKGNRKHLHCTALGKAILSQFSEGHVRTIIEKHGMPTHTGNTIASPEELFKELEEVRETGIAFDDEEILEGLRCVASPIQHPKTDLVGAISVSGPTNRFKGERFRNELPELVRGASNVIQVNASQV